MAIDVVSQVSWLVQSELIDCFPQVVGAGMQFEKLVDSITLQELRRRLASAYKARCLLSTIKLTRMMLLSPGFTPTGSRL